MKVYIPSPLRSYTGETSLVESRGGNVAELLGELDGRFPGLRFRIIDEQDGIREHIKIFVNCEQVRDLKASLAAGDEVHILCALSGG
jgi:molybdopterin converting factor small subunit